MHFRVRDSDFIIRAYVCDHLEADGVLNGEFKRDYELQVLNLKNEELNEDEAAHSALLNQLIDQNKDLFADKITDLSSSSTVKHRIETRDARPVKQVPRRIPFHLRPEIGETIAELRESGVIIPSKSDWAANIVPVRKKDGTMRLCVDSRDVNDLTVKDCYPVPRIDDTIDRFHNIKEFTTLDCFAGYYQVIIHEDDRHKTAFTTPSVYSSMCECHLACATLQRHSKG